MNINKELIIRNAEIKDSEFIVSLTCELGYQATLDEIENKINKFIHCATEEVFVIEFQKIIIGWMHVSLVEPLESNPFVEVRGIVVDSEHRKKGIGTKLIQTAEQWAKDNGCKKIRIRTNIKREETRKYYRNQNFISRKTQEVFEKEL